MATELTIVPDSLRMEWALSAAADEGSLVDAAAFMTLADVVRVCAPPVLERRPLAGALLQEALILRLAPECCGAAFGGHAGSIDFAVHARRLFDGLEAQLATPAALELAARGLSNPARTVALAELWRRLWGQLEALGLQTAGQQLAVATRRLESGLPRALRRFSGVVVKYVVDAPPARLRFLRALASAVQGIGQSFAWWYPQSGSASVDLLAAHTLRQIERDWQTLDAQVMGDDAHQGLGWVLPLVFEGEGEVGPVAGLTGFTARTPDAEAQEVASRARRLIREGLSPESLVVLTPSVVDDAERWSRAFAAAGVPLRVRRSTRLASTPVGRFVLTLAGLAERRFRAADVLAVFGAPYASRWALGEVDVLRYFDQAGVVDEGRGATEGRSAYDVRLEALALRSRERDQVLKVRDACAELKTLAALPAEERLETFVSAWWQLVLALGTREAVLHATAERRHEEAAAWELASFEALERLVQELTQTFAQVQGPRVSRRVFTEYLTRACELEVTLPGPRAGAVWLLAPGQLAGLTFSHAFVTGLEDGRFPARGASQSLVSEEERAQLNVAAGQQLFRLAVVDGGLSAPLALANDRLAFGLALSCAPQVCLSSARGDGEGKELLPSPFVEALARALPAWRRETLSGGAVPRLEKCETETALRARVCLEAFCPPSTRQSQAEPAAAELASVLEPEPWFERVRHVAHIEAERSRFFSEPEMAAGRASGLIEARELVAEMLKFDASGPLSARMLGEFGNCHFQGFSARLLKLTAHEEEGENISRSRTGDFWHGVLQRAVPRLVEKGLWQRAGVTVAQVRPVVAEAVAEAAERAPSRGATGHPTLWALAQSRAADVLAMFLVDPSSAYPGFMPQAYERSFGGRGQEPVTLPAAFEGETPLALRGDVDRIDAGHEGMLALDYKLTKAGTPGERLQELLATDFQLPLYAFAVQQLTGAESVDAAWVGLTRREGLKLSQVMAYGEVSMKELLDVSRAGREESRLRGPRRNLANEVHGLVNALRAGDFGPRAHDCRRCEFRAVCRVGMRAVLPEWGSLG